MFAHPASLVDKGVLAGIRQALALEGLQPFVRNDRQSNSNNSILEKTMKTKIRLIALLAGVLISQLCIAQAPAGAPAGSTGMCNDGTYSTAAAKKGACRGHKGVKEWYAGAATAPTNKPTAAVAPAAPAPASTPTSSHPAKTSADTATTAPGGGAGQVWLNTATNVYHCQGTKWYGKTKAGAYMTEAEAKAKGAHADHGKACN